MRAIKELASRLPAALAVFLLAAALTSVVAAPAAAGDTVSITSLIENMKRYDGQSVTIRGEVIGDLMVRGEYAWITVNDDKYSKKSIEEGGALVGMSNVGIAVWLPAADARQVKMLGGYKTKGAIVSVAGIFNRACKEHGGDTDIHASRITILQNGHPFSHPFKWDELLAIIVLGIAIALLWYWRVVKRRKWAREE